MKIKPKTSQVIAKSVIWLVALIVIGVLIAIITYILYKGLPHINSEFLFSAPSNSGREGGIAPMIIRTLLVTLVAVGISMPFGIGTAFYLAEYTKDGIITRIIRFSAESLAGIPSIVYGLFGLIFFVEILGLGWSVLSGGLTLAIMILPTIIRTSEEAIRAVPKTYREVSFSLGATKWQTIRKAVAPSAIRGITNGVILSVGRCFAETAAVMLTAGDALKQRTLAVHFYKLATEGISINKAFATASVLIIVIFFINVVANMLIDRFMAKGR